MEWVAVCDGRMLHTRQSPVRGRLGAWLAESAFCRSALCGPGERCEALREEEPWRGKQGPHRETGRRVLVAVRSVEQ